MKRYIAPFHLDLFSIYDAEDIPKELRFGHRAYEPSNDFSVLEHNIGRCPSNPILLGRLPTINHIYFCKGERIRVLSGNFGDNWHHLLAEYSRIIFEFDHNREVRTEHQRLKRRVSNFNRDP